MKTTLRSHWIVFLFTALLIVFTTIDASWAQSKQPVPPPRKNAMELDVAGLSLGLSYARWTWGSWFLGGGFGVGPTLMFEHYSEKTQWGAEVAHLRVFISRRAFRWLTIDAAPYLGLNFILPALDCDFFCFSPIWGAKVTALAGWRNVKLGPSIQAGWLQFIDSYYVALTPLTVRLTLDW